MTFSGEGFTVEPGGHACVNALSNIATNMDSSFNGPYTI